MAVKPRLTKQLLLFILFGLLLLVVYFYYFVDTGNMASVIQRTSLSIYALAFAAFVTSVLFSSLAWHSLLRNLNIKAKLPRVLLFMWVGMFFDAIVPEPGWSGDLSKAYLLAKSTEQDAGRIGASVIGQKIIVMVVTIVDLILGLVLLSLNYTLSSMVLIFIVGVLFLSTFFLTMILYFSAKPKATKRLLEWLIRGIAFVRRGHWDSTDFQTRAEDTLNRFHEGIRTLSADPKTLLRPVTFSFMSWGFDVSVIFLAFSSLGYAVPVDKVLIVYALTGSLQAMGVSFVGFTEIVMSSAYNVLGILPAVSLFATLLTRGVTLWFKLIVSYGAFQWAGAELLLGKNQELQPNLKASGAIP